MLVLLQFRHGLYSPLQVHCDAERIGRWPRLIPICPASEAQPTATARTRAPAAVAPGQTSAGRAGRHAGCDTSRTADRTTLAFAWSSSSAVLRGDGARANHEVPPPVGHGGARGQAAAVLRRRLRQRDAIHAAPDPKRSSEPGSGTGAVSSNV